MTTLLMFGAPQRGNHTPEAWLRASARLTRCHKAWRRQITPMANRMPPMVRTASRNLRQRITCEKAKDSCNKPGKEVTRN